MPNNARQDILNNCNIDLARIGRPPLKEFMAVLPAELGEILDVERTFDAFNLGRVSPDTPSSENLLSWAITACSVHSAATFATFTTLTPPIVYHRAGAE